MFRNAVLALVFGVPLSVVLLVPVAAVLYRREGRIALGAVLQLVVAAVYFCALWTYTLLPIPAARELPRCAVPQWEPFAFVGDVLRLGVGSPSAVLQNPAVLQVVLNVALFTPLGFGVRLLLRRGVVVAAVIGLGASLIIEVTQVTGIYGIYSCAYRLFDVDDLLANTVGAVVGSAASSALVRPRPKRTMTLVQVPVTLGRRLLGLVADAVLITFLQVVLVAGWAAWANYGGGPALASVPVVRYLLVWGLPALIELVLVLRFGGSAGELLVLIRNERGTGGRWRQALFGATGYCLLGAFESLQPVFVAVTLIAVLVTRDRRGLSRLLSGGTIVAHGRPNSQTHSDSDKPDNALPSGRSTSH